ncbi:MAG: type II toxin-antitoxin system VapC family toxin [Actinobacteria bacterium]|nr:type II toxin-antitoxin system VapC family toxin [Actinomycetota bacterium]
MITYIDSSVLARAYLIDEIGHSDAVALLDDTEMGLVTGTWTRIDVAGALVRAARSGRGDEAGLLDLLARDLSVDGPVAVVAAPQRDVESRAYEIVRTHGIRATDAWHLAVACIVCPALVEPSEPSGFATRDERQSAVAVELGFVPV